MHLSAFSYFKMFAAASSLAYKKSYHISFISLYYYIHSPTYSESWPDKTDGATWLEHYKIKNWIITVDKNFDKFFTTQFSISKLSEGGSISKHYFLDLPEGHLFVNWLLVANVFYYS